jgi:hypothetical protein
VKASTCPFPWAPCRWQQEEPEPVLLYITAVQSQEASWRGEQYGTSCTLAPVLYGPVIIRDMAFTPLLMSPHRIARLRAMHVLYHCQ